MKPVLLAATGGLGSMVAAVQAIGETHVAVSTVAAFVGSGLIGGILLYLVRRVNSLPAEEAEKRHAATDRVNEVILRNYDQLEAEQQRADARHLGAVEAMETRLLTALKDAERRLKDGMDQGFAREMTERHTFDQRLRDCERELPRRGASDS